MALKAAEKVDDKGRVLSRDYASWEEYFANKYPHGDTRINVANGRLFEAIEPFLENVEEYEQSDGSARLIVSTEDAKISGLDTHQLEKSILDDRQSYDLSGQDREKLDKALGLLVKHNQIPNRRLKEFVQQCVEQIALGRDGGRLNDNFGAEKVVVTDKLRQISLAAYMFLLCCFAACFKVAYADFQQGKFVWLAVTVLVFVLCVLMHNAFMLIKGLPYTLPNHRYEILRLLSSVRWKYPPTDQHLSRAGRRFQQKMRKRANGTSAANDAVSLHKDAEFVRVHGVAVPAKALKKPLRSPQTKQKI